MVRSALFLSHLLLPPSPEHKAEEEVKEQLSHRTALVRIWDLCSTCVTDIQSKSFFSVEGREETLADTSQISSPGTSDSKTTLPGTHAAPFSSQLPTTIHPIPCVHLFFFGPHCLMAFLGRMIFKKSLSISISSTSVPKKPCLCPTTGGNATCFYYSLRSSITRKGQPQLLNS